ncbi:MAG: hypothetical protein RLW62_10350 [Gammaproteobacteria bacterium]
MPSIVSSFTARQRTACRRALLAAMIAAVGATATAADELLASGIGTRDCRAFNAALAEDSALAIDAYVAWSQGFISAFNWANVRQRNVRIDAAAVLNWLGQYCAANPRAHVYQAVQEIVRLNAR